MKIWLEHKTRMMLETLSCHLSDGQVDYECSSGEHKFTITRAGIRFKVRLAEHSLAKKSVDELQLLVREVVTQVRSKTSARQN